MSLAWVSISLLVLVLALIPLAIKWLQRRVGGAGAGLPMAMRVVSAVGVGPHQRVVTVEIGPEGARTWLTLGVTGQSITCLHTADAVKVPANAPLVEQTAPAKLP